MLKKSINWKLFFTLLISCMISVFAVFPYVLTVQGEALRNLGVPISTLVIAQTVQSLVLFSILIFLGLKLIQKTGFNIPYIEAILSKRKYKNINYILKTSILWGIGVSVAIYIIDSIFTSLGVAISTHQNLAPIWQKLLAAFYGGIVEEITMRLFLMTLLVWVGMKLFKQKQPTDLIVYVSILMAAVIFGLGHLPITASVTKIDTFVVARAVVLNGIGGIIFGWLYWKRGLEAAIVAHFTADIFLLTLLPLIIK